MGKITIEQAREFSKMGINRQKIRIRKSGQETEQKNSSYREMRKKIRYIKEGGFYCF